MVECVFKTKILVQAEYDAFSDLYGIVKQHYLKIVKLSEFYKGFFNDYDALENELKLRRDYEAV